MPPPGNTVLVLISVSMLPPLTIQWFKVRSIIPMTIILRMSHGSDDIPVLVGHSPHRPPFVGRWLSMVVCTFCGIERSSPLKFRLPRHLPRVRRSGVVIQMGLHYAGIGVLLAGSRYRIFPKACSWTHFPRFKVGSGRTGVTFVVMIFTRIS